MVFSYADFLLDRSKLKSSVRRWRLVSFLLLSIVIVFGFANTYAPKVSGDTVSGKKLSMTSSVRPYIGRLYINGVIVENQERHALLKDIKANNKIKALVIEVNSPGGTAAGSEVLYNLIREISEVKPVVILMGTLAASGGYLLSLAGDHIIARNNTLTGSIGVIFRSFEVVDLANKVGIKSKVFRSNELKGAPSLFEASDEKVDLVMNNLVMDIYNYFIAIVAERRKMDIDEVRELADGRVYMGKIALSNGLIDEIGDEAQALRWLESEKGIVAPIKDVVSNRWKDKLDLIFSNTVKKYSVLNSLVEYAGKIDGLLMLWDSNVVCN